jgi:acyl-CoA synthetase (AMP-forming)/AMP-acid ligase II
MAAFDVAQGLVPELIAQHGRWQADKPAAVCGDETLSWADFDRRTNQIGRALLANGLESGQRLAVLMSNSLDMLEVLFGAGKAGLCVVPLNLSIADAALAAMIRDSDARAVVASGAERDRVDALLAQGELSVALHRIGTSAPRAGWGDLRRLRDAQPFHVPPVAVAPQAECNIIYSSGTTGLPKGIVHSHQCRLHWAQDMAIALRYHSGAITVLSLGLYSNISWVAMLATILVGGTMVIMPAFGASGLLQQVERHRISHGAFVPVQLQRLLDCPDLGLRDLRSLQTIMCCGSPLPAPVKRAARDRLGCDLIELYGLTEGIVTVLSPEDFDSHLDSVGKPIPGQEIRILGADDHEVAAGEPGEVAGYGRLAMDGYHRRPEANSEATWRDSEGRRWLRSGDIGRIDSSGFLHIVDRKKDMIISGGQNIYAVDVESVLVQHPQVAEVAVVGAPSERWGETPIAIVVPRARAAGQDVIPDDSAAEALRQWANARLGKQQRIHRVFYRDSLPRNPNGKILKRELRRELAESGAGNA